MKDINFDNPYSFTYPFPLIPYFLKNGFIIWKIIKIIIEVLIVYLVIGRILKRFIHFPAPPYVRFFLDSRLRKWMQPAS